VGYWTPPKGALLPRKVQQHIEKDEHAGGDKCGEECSEGTIKNEHVWLSNCWPLERTMLRERCRRFIGTVPHLCAHTPPVFRPRPVARRDFFRGTDFFARSLNRAVATAHALTLSSSTDSPAAGRRGFRSATTLSSSLNVQLTDALRKYVDERVSDKDVYATPSEYIRDLIRQDMQDRAVALNILEGLDDLKHGRFSSKSIRDFKNKG
jgi:antitoxin ParD1/3/4